MIASVCCINTKVYVEFMFAAWLVTTIPFPTVLLYNFFVLRGTFLIKIPTRGLLQSSCNWLLRQEGPSWHDNQCPSWRDNQCVPLLACQPIARGHEYHYYYNYYTTTNTTLQKKINRETEKYRAGLEISCIDESQAGLRVG